MTDTRVRGRMRAALLAATLLLSTLSVLALAAPAAASDVCVPIPNGNHITYLCLDEQRCTSLGFCADPSDPKGTAFAFVAWLRDELTCTCPPQ